MIRVKASSDPLGPRSVNVTQVASSGSRALRGLCVGTGDEQYKFPESVYLTVVIGADGKVQDVKIIGGDSRFVDLVVDAVKRFVYEPQVVDGKPTAATVEAIYHFGQRP